MFFSPHILSTVNQSVLTQRGNVETRMDSSANAGKVVFGTTGDTTFTVQTKLAMAFDFTREKVSLRLLNGVIGQWHVVFATLRLIRV